MKVKIKRKIDELFALPGKPGKRVEEDEEFPEIVHKKANKWASEPGMTRKQAYGKAIGMHKSGDLKETFPHGGLPYGAARKQDGDKEHAGHVERALHQGRREVMLEDNDTHKEAIRAIGFGNIEYINKGMFGSVYKGTWDEHDGVERAIKVLRANGSGKYEAKVYRTISDARKENDLIAKHFPRVDMIRLDQKNQLVLIVMELLEDDPNAKAVIQDIFGQGEVGRFRADLSLDDMDIQKNIGKRANLMVTDEKTKEMILDKMIYDVPNRQEEVKRNMMNLNFRGIKRQPKIYKTISRHYKTGIKLFDTIDVLRDDLLLGTGKLMGAEAFSFAIRFIYECMKAWEKDFDEDFETLFSEIKPALEQFIYMYRTWTPVGISPMGRESHLYGAPARTKGAGYPGAGSILDAIQAVRSITGLGAQDMHDQNVLVRPATKELVIVDVGLFQQKSSRPKSAASQITALEGVNKKDFLKVIIEEIEAVELDEKKKKRKKAGTESGKESSLRDWFGRKGAKGKKKGWVDCNAPDGKGGYKSCGRSSGEKRKKYPACRPTPGACKERGKGKSWGKKAKKRGKKK